MKKYFQFKKFKESFKGFIILMILLVSGQCYDGRMSVEELVRTDLMLVILYIIGSVVVDWVRIIYNNKKEK